MATEVDLNESSIGLFLNDPGGPVGDLLFEMATEGEGTAKGLAPVREGNVWNEETTSARPPGFTKASIHAKRGVSQAGNLYGSVNVEADPGIFLSFPAKQLHRTWIFMHTALWSITPL